MSEKHSIEVEKFLKSKGIAYRIIEHKAVYTSEQAAKERGFDARKGVKAMVCKAGKQFVLALLPGDSRIDFKKLASLNREKKACLASSIEVLEKTECEIGSVSPFGNLYGLKTFMDKKVLENEEVEFNIGMHTKSIHMKAKDLKKAVKPIMEEFAL